jgi:anti-sigma factor RsiW
MIDDTKGKACSQHEALLEDLVTGALHAADAQRVEAHALECAGCRQALRDARESMELLRLAQATPDPGPGFARVVMARIRQEESLRAEEKGGLWGATVAVASRLALSATLALGLLLAYGTLGNSGQSSNLTAVEAASNSSPDLFGDPIERPASRDAMLMMVAEPSHGK